MFNYEKQNNNNMYTLHNFEKFENYYFFKKEFKL